MGSFLTPAQVAEQLQVTQYTIYMWLRDGYLRGSKLGRIWRVSQEDLASFLRDSQNAPAARPFSRLRQGASGESPDGQTNSEEALAGG